MRISFVVQRYGTEIVGGAERLCRGVAEGLAGRGHEVEVLTTCAHSYATWGNAFPEGLESINGVQVRRFLTKRERDMETFNAQSERLFDDAHDPEDERSWVDAQGPYVPRLVDHLHSIANDRDRLVFFTYLYYPTVHGIHAAPQQSVLVPTAHDEGPFYLPIYDAVFSLPAGLIFNTEAEASLVRRRFTRLSPKTEVIGAGIDHLDDLGDQLTDAAETDRDPVVLYAGRIEPGKGVEELIDYLGRFRADSGRAVRLWLMGELAMELPAEAWIDVLGFVPEEEKLSRLRRATVTAVPSALESFAIVALESMVAGTPVLANAASGAAVEHCRRGNGGLYYRGYLDFRESLSLLLDDAVLRGALAKEGGSYVRSNYSWPRIVERYESFLTDL